MLHINQDNYSGFELTFDNGWKVSVQFGPNTLSDNQNNTGYNDSTDAEVRVWDNLNNPYVFETINSPVLPHTTADKIADVMTFIRNMESV